MYSGGGGGSIVTGTTPITGGATTQVLFHDAGVVGSDAGLTYNKTTDVLSLLKAGNTATLELGASVTADRPMVRAVGGAFLHIAGGTTGIAFANNDGTSFTANVTSTGWKIGDGDAAAAKLDVGSVTGTQKALVVNNGTSTGNIIEGQNNAAEVFAFGDNNLWHTFAGAPVASAAAIVPTGNLFHVTGTTTITSITSTGIVAGTQITIIFDGILTFTDGSNLVLASDFVTTANDTITLVFDGTNWHEISRSIN